MKRFQRMRVVALVLRSLAPFPSLHHLLSPHHRLRHRSDRRRTPGVTHLTPILLGMVRGGTVEEMTMTTMIIAGLRPRTGDGCLEVRPEAVIPHLGEAEVTRAGGMTIVTTMTPTPPTPEPLVVAPTSDRLSSC